MTDDPNGYTCPECYYWVDEGRTHFRRSRPGDRMVRVDGLVHWLRGFDATDPEAVVLPKAES